LDISTLLQSILNGFSSAGIYILVALGLTLVLSIMNIVQLAHGEIYMIGAYGVYYITTSLGLNFFLALVISTLLMGGLGIVLERLCFRPLRGQFDRAAIASIGLILILQNVVLSIAGGDPRSYMSPFTGVLKILGVAISWDRLSIVLFGFGLVAALFLFIRMTKTGQAILMKGIAVIILGGLGSIPGAVVGGLIIGLIDGIMPILTTTHIAGLIGFGAIIIILLFRPQGISGHE